MRKYLYSLLKWNQKNIYPQNDILFLILKYHAEPEHVLFENSIDPNQMAMSFVGLEQDTSALYSLNLGRQEIVQT